MSVNTFTENLQKMIKSFTCPLTLSIMRDPVIGSDGHSYERSAIERALTINSISPMTRQPMLISELQPNRALKDLIDQYQQQGLFINAEEVVISPTELPNTTQTPLNANITMSYIVDQKRQKCALTLTPPNITERSGKDIVAVIDVSGSMGSPASMTDVDGHNVNNGLSCLDLVKHALKTIIMNLEPKDRLSLVVFDTNAKVVFGLREMTETNKTQSIAQLECQKPGCTTNLWGGLKNGLDIVKRRSDVSRNASICLLTDGIPNVRPARSETDMLARYFTRNPNVKVNVHTFGFGYQLESKMLYDLSVEGNGLYNFIPDSSFVGTVFVNTVSYILSCMTLNTCLKFLPSDQITSIYVQTTNTTRKREQMMEDRESIPTFVNIGPIQFGQPRTVVFRYEHEQYIPIEDIANVTLSFNNNSFDKSVSTEITIPTQLADRDIYNYSNKIKELEVRLWIATDILLALKQSERGHLIDSQKKIVELISEIRREQIANVGHIMEDLEGQITIAFSRQDYVKKWGRHYLRSLVRAHQLQVCSNFKDPGVQKYGGELFTMIQEKADDVFNTLPPPKPSISYYSMGGGNSQPVTNMRQYNSSSNPCFAGQCQIVMSGGNKKKVGDLVKGDKLHTPHGEATLVCVLKTQCELGQAELIRFDDGLIITPWHPIKMKGAPSWVFPIHVNASVNMVCPYVYSLILDKGHIVTINNINCITLGHNYKDDVIRHPYFGSQKIINDLKKMPGWKKGLILLKSGCLKANGGMVNEIVYNGN